MFDDLGMLSGMGNTPFELTEEQEHEFREAAETLYEVCEKHDIPVLIFATLGNEDIGDSMRLKSALMSHIDTRKANPPLAVIAAALSKIANQRDGVPTYIKLLSGCIVLATKEEGMAASFELMAALLPVIKPYISVMEKEARERRNRMGKEDLDGLDSFSELFARLELELEDEDEDEDN